MRSVKTVAAGNLVATLRQAAAVAVAGAAAGLALNAVHARGLAFGRPVHAAAEAGTGVCVGDARPIVEIGAESAAALCNDCTVAFVDARTASAYAAGHVAGALHLPPLGHPDERARLAELVGKQTVVAYDDASHCNLAQSVAQRLRTSGVADVRVLAGGWPGWQRLGQPAASGACEQCARHAHP